MISVWATRFRTEQEGQPTRKLLEAYLKVETDNLKKHQMLGLIGEILDIRGENGETLTTPEIEEVLNMCCIPAARLARKQDDEHAPLDAKALKWIAEGERLLAEDARSSFK